MLICVFSMFENGWFVILCFIEGDIVIFVDLVVYVEIGQFQLEFINFFDFSFYVNVQWWFVDMYEVFYYDDVYFVFV